MRTLSRFHCPRCDAALTPWLRPLTMPEVLCLTHSHTWLLPREHFIHIDDPLLAGAIVPRFASYPWLLPPQDLQYLKHHPDRGRTTGCCGLAYRDEHHPNLVCSCGAEVGLGYLDCCNPYWYALHTTVLRETAEDDEAPPDVPARLARARALVTSVEVPAEGCRAGGSSVMHHDADSWRCAHPLRAVDLACGGGESSPVLLLTSNQLAGPLLVPIAWPQLLRFLVLGETAYGDPDNPTEWAVWYARNYEPHINISRRDARILLTIWQREKTWSVTMPVRAWTDAWARLSQ